MILKTVGFQCVFMMIWSMIRMKKGISSLEAYLEKTAAALICSNRSQVQGSTFSAASDRRSGQFDRKRDSSVAESHTRVKDKKSIEDPKPSSKMLIFPHNCQIPCSGPACLACHVRNGHIPRGRQWRAGLWGCGIGRFSRKNVYKMTYGDENATFEPLNL